MLKLKPKSTTIQAVIVVPMFAPRVTPTDCCKVISPAFTNETSMAVVAPDDWMIMVRRKPVIKPVKRLPVIKPRAF